MPTLKCPLPKRPVVTLPRRLDSPSIKPLKPPMGSEHTLLPMKQSGSAGSATLPRFRLGALSPVPCGKAGLAVTCPDSSDPPQHRWLASTIPECLGPHCCCGKQILKMPVTCSAYSRDTAVIQLCSRGWTSRVTWSLPDEGRGGWVRTK